MNYAKDGERHHIAHQAMRETTMYEVIHATEDLGNMKEIAEEQQAERSREARTEVAA